MIIRFKNKQLELQNADPNLVRINGDNLEVKDYHIESDGVFASLFTCKLSLNLKNGAYTTKRYMQYNFNEQRLFEHEEKGEWDLTNCEIHIEGNPLKRSFVYKPIESTSD